jgi:hypothetical protein
MMAEDLAAVSRQALYEVCSSHVDVHSDVPVCVSQCGAADRTHHESNYIYKIPCAARRNQRINNDNIRLVLTCANWRFCKCSTTPCQMASPSTESTIAASTWICSCLTCAPTGGPPPPEHGNPHGHHWAADMISNPSSYPSLCNRRPAANDSQCHRALVP